MVTAQLLVIRVGNALGLLDVVGIVAYFSSVFVVIFSDAFKWWS